MGTATSFDQLPPNCRNERAFNRVDAQELLQSELLLPYRFWLTYNVLLYSYQPLH